MKYLTLCLFAVLAAAVEQRNYGCPTGCSCTLVPASGCTPGGGGTCACATVGPAGAFTGCTISGMAPAQSGVAPNGCITGSSLSCVDLRTSANNCGSCGRVCLSGTCSGGLCGTSGVTFVGNSSFHTAVANLANLQAGTTGALNENQLIVSIANLLGTALGGLQSQSNVIFLTNPSYIAAVNTLANLPPPALPDQPAVDQGLANLGHYIAAVLTALEAT